MNKVFVKIEFTKVHNVDNVDENKNNFRDNEVIVESCGDIVKETDEEQGSHMSNSNRKEKETDERDNIHNFFLYLIIT